MSSDSSEDMRLAVYGTLAPGEVNHYVIADLAGEWIDGFVTGELRQLDFPGLIWQADGPRVPVKVFCSPELPAHWQRIDEFEGGDYRRVVVPVEAGGGVLRCNLYERRTGGQ